MITRVKKSLAKRFDQFQVTMNPALVSASHQIKRNQLGGSFVNGKPLSREKRRRIIELALLGFRASDISKRLKVTHGCISKMLAKYKRTGSIDPPRTFQEKERVMMSEARHGMEQYARPRAATFSWETPGGHPLAKQYNATTPLVSSSVWHHPDEIHRNVFLHQQEKAESNLGAFPYVPNALPNFYQGPSNATYQPFSGGATNSIPGVLSRATAGPSNASFRPFSAGCSADSIPGALPQPTAAFPNGSVSTQGLPFGLPRYLPAFHTRRRPRIRYTCQQLAELEREFQKTPYPSTLQRSKISANLKLNATRVQVWFANRRSKARKQSGIHVNESVRDTERHSADSSEASNPQPTPGPSPVYCPTTEYFQPQHAP